jgi:hypothetical protein
MKGSAMSQSLVIPRLASEEEVREEKKRGWSQETVGLACLGGLNVVLFTLLLSLLYKGLNTYVIVGQ